MISSLTYMARLATPDMLVAALTVAGSFCLLRAATMAGRDDSE